MIADFNTYGNCYYFMEKIHDVRNESTVRCAILQLLDMLIGGICILVYSGTLEKSKYRVVT